MLKNLGYLLLVMVAFSCKKVAVTTETVKEVLPGHWNYGTLYQNDYDANGKLLKSTRLEAKANNDYWEFRADNTFTKTFNGRSQKTSGNYEILSTVKFNIKYTTDSYTYTCRLISLSPEQLIFVVQDFKLPGTPYTEYVHTLTK